MNADERWFGCSTPLRRFDPHPQPALRFRARTKRCKLDLGKHVLEPPMQRDFSSFVEINRLTKNHVILVDSIKNLAFRKNITGTVKQRDEKTTGTTRKCDLRAFAGIC